MTAELTGLPRYVALATPGRPPRRARAAWLRSRRPSEGLTWFLLSLVGYVGVAVEMLHRNVIFADAVARVANGYYVLFSRDPHLPAVGFVWNPLPSLLLLPVLPLKAVFPSLVRDGFAGNLESALFMAGAVALMASCLAVMGVRRVPRLVLVALFALHPMIITYAGSGQSEAIFLFFLLLAVRSLLRWLAVGRPGQLVLTGMALGVAYLCRYEAVAPGLAVAALVGLITLFRGAGGGPLASRLGYALNDAALVFLPIAFSFGLWAVSSRLLVGQWFPTFSSQYGNSAQVDGSRLYIAQAIGSSTPEVARYAAAQLAGLAPLGLVLLVSAAVVAIRRRDQLALAAPVVLGAVLAFTNLATLSGSSFGWLRFQITVIPLAVLLAGTLLRQPSPARPSPARPSPGRSGAWMRPAKVGVVPLVLLAVAAGLPSSAWTLTSHALAREETATMLAAVAPGLATEGDRRHLTIFQLEHQIADDLDAMALPDGAVLTDSAFAFPIVLASRRPTKFVITSDRDFTPILANPVGYGVRYLLVPQPDKAPSDALERAWPGLYEGQSDIATVVRTWRSPALSGDWRLLQVRG